MNGLFDFQDIVEQALTVVDHCATSFTEPDNDHETRLLLGLEGNVVEMVYLRDLCRPTHCRAHIHKRIQELRRDGRVLWAALVQLRWAVDVERLGPLGKTMLQQLGPADSPDRIPVLMVEVATRQEFAVWGARELPRPDAQFRFGPFRQMNPELGQTRIRGILRWLTHKK